MQMLTLSSALCSDFPLENTHLVSISKLCIMKHNYAHKYPSKIFICRDYNDVSF